MPFRILLVTCVALVGCKSELNPAYCAAHPTDSRCVTGDAAVGDGEPDSFVPPTCVGEGNYQVCLQVAPTTSPNLATNINTSSSMCLAKQPVGWVESGQPAACFIAGIDITIAASITARGPRPLVIVATDSITLTGSIDGSAAKNAPTTIPAGYVPAACAAFPQLPASGATGGGGAGGTFIEVGGDGGTGDMGNSAGGHPAAAGVMPTLLHAGCGGQPGGDGAAGGGIGGNGGGAIYLIAVNTLTLSTNSSIDVSGAGGNGGGHQAGGGGAGSGGMIVLAAETVMVGSGVTLLSNGGGGGAGGTVTANGGNGNDPTSPTSPALGATSAAMAAGGNGYAATTQATTGGGANANVGGGGGGGGGGYIQATQPLTGATVSPTETVIP